MYSIACETDEPTAVNLSAVGRLLPDNSKQLVTVGSKCLKIYRFNPYAIVETENDSFTQTMRLECLLTFNLMAPVRSLAVERIPLYPKADSIMMTFDDAKLSIVNVNPKTMTLNTLSLHSMEDEFLRDGYTKEIYSPELRVDPKKRCAAFLVYGRHLAVIPFAEGREQLPHSYTIPLRSFDERLDNILDMTFLDGYYEPTLLFLYEPIKTTAGRACVRFETVWILGVSLNIKDRVHAIVWNFGGMPTTVDRCLRVPSPVNGVCLIGVNEIIYLNQSVPPCGISVNSCADEYVKFPFNDLKSLRLSLDGSVMEMIDPNHALLGLRSGDLYVLHFEVDQANVVKSLKLEKCFETSIPHTITHCGPGFAFLGSRLGDSMLLEYTRKIKQRNNGITEQPEVASPVNSHDSGLLHEEELYLYQSDPNSSVERSTEFDFTFRVIDTISNVGPCKYIRGCAANNIGSLFRQRKPSNLFFNLVSVSGHEQNSSLCFFERTIRPDVMNSSVLSDAVQFWSVGRKKDGSHRYLIIAREMNTLILELENDMIEMDRPLFLSSETTVAAGELGDGEISVQVTAMNIVMVGNDEQLQLISIDSNFPVVTASIADPFIVLLTQNGRVLLYRLVTYPEISLVLVPMVSRMIHDKSPVTSLCIYKDISGIVQPCTNDGPPVVHTGNDKAERNINFSLDSNILKKEEFDSKRTANDEIDELLYGDEEKRALQRENQKRGAADEMDADFNGEPTPIETSVHNPNHVMPTYWMCLARETGNLYIYSLPEFQLVYLVKKFNLQPEILYDDVALALEDDHATRQQQQASANALLGLNPTHPQQQPHLITQTASENTKQSSSVIVRPEEVIMEIQIYGTGMNQSRPILSALIDDTVVFYEMFPYDDSEEGYKGHLAIRFRRLKHSVITRSGRFLGPNGRATVESARDTERHRHLIHTFERVGSLSSGFFITGGYPSILFVDRGELRLHPVIIDGPIVSFTSFNNSNCPNGFLYLTKKERAMRIALLPSEVNYDASYPYRKVGTLGSVHFVTYLLQQNIFGIITSERTYNLKQCNIVNEDKQFEILERDDTFVPPLLNTFTLKLFSTENWSFVPGTEFKFEEFEVVTCMEEVLLSSESTVAGLKSYLAVGTALNYSEEVFVRGRVILCEIIDVVPEEGLPTSRHRLKVVYDKEQKGPVTSMCSSNGYLLTGMGQKVFIWQFRDGELHGVSFLDMHFYVHSLVAFRNLAVACDLYRSLSLIRYQEQFKALSLVSRDLRPSAPPPMAANFLIDNKQMGFVLTDEAGNITIFNYLPEMKESVGGERLILRAVINIGSLINSFVRVRGHVDDCFSDNAEQTREMQSCIFATLDGSFGVVRPLAEKVFRRLHMLQQVMTVQVPQPGGLHPRGSRAPRPARTDTNQQLATARNIIDGNLVFQYLFLGTQEKTDFARKLGTSRYQIIDDLEKIRRVMTHF